MMNKAPEGAMARVFGSYYKIGIHGKVFRFDDGEWKLSSRSRESIKVAMMEQDGGVIC
jgi:hypothetical protein